MPCCRVCGKEIKKVNKDWIMPSKNYYYHITCYEEWRTDNSTKKDEEYVSLIYNYISVEKKFNYNYHMCEKQRKLFINKYHYTNKGILFTLKYLYDIKGNDWGKSYGGIGIIPYVYKEACEYWTTKEKKEQGTISLIIQELKKIEEAPKKEIEFVTKTSKQKKKYCDLNSIEVEND